MKLVQVKIYRGERYYIAECIDIPLFTYGRTLDEVVEKMRKAIEPRLKKDGLKEWEIPPDFSILLNLELPSLAEEKNSSQIRFS